jgi:RND family efflux transporter MFP subunit
MTNSGSGLKKLIIYGVLIIFSVFVTLVIVARVHQELRLAQETNKEAITVVQIIKATANSANDLIILPGSVLAWHEADLYSRANGYLKEWYVDIGYQVKQGDVLAIISRPELDAKLAAAKDNLKSITAQYELAQITADRWSKLVETDSVSKQDNDNKSYEAQSLASQLKEAQANVDNLSAYVSFEQIVAPFDGTISLRQTDLGDLINIGSNGTQAPLFHLVQTDPLRLYVNIPQTYVSELTRDMAVSLRFAEHPGRVFSAKLLKMSGAINPKTLTLEAEFKVQNTDHILLPGSYTAVELSLARPQDSVIIPVNSLIFQEHGLQVATVDENHHVIIKNIEIGTDYGNTVQINSGLKPGEEIIINPIDTLYSGQLVMVSQVDKSIL